jgi:hypothetical protein
LRANRFPHRECRQASRTRREFPVTLSPNRVGVVRACCAAATGMEFCKACCYNDLAMMTVRAVTGSVPDAPNPRPVGSMATSRNRAWWITKP